MVEVVNSNGLILSFDGRVIEKFDNSNQRVHVKHVKSVEVKEGRKGDLEIRVPALYTLLTLMKIDPDQRGAVDEFVAQVNAARPAG